MIKNILFFSFLLLSLNLLSGQTLSRQVISATGSASNTLSYTVGEPVVETAIAGSFILTQGFQQPDQTAVNVKKPLQIQVDYKLYPNPSHDLITLELESAKQLDLRIDIVDMAGKQVRQTETMKVDGLEKRQFDVSKFASGNYLMRIMTSSNQPVKTLRFKRLD